MGRASANAAVSVERFFQFSLLGLVTSGFLAVSGSGFLDTPVMALAAAGLALRALVVAGILRFPPSDRAVTVITLAYIAFFPVDYYLLSRDFLRATVHLIIFLAVIKVLSARTARDDAFAAVIAFMELLAAAILSARLNFFLFLTLYLVFSVAAFTSAEIRRAAVKPQRVARAGLRRFPLRLGAVACFIACGILSLTGGLFFLLPRTAGAALDRMASHHIFLPGFSNRVSLGEIGEVKINSTPVMHVLVDKPELAANVKWRGGALAWFDGRNWSNPALPGRILRLDKRRVILDNFFGRRGKHFSYSVELNAADTATLFFAGLPEVLEMRSPTVIRTVDDNYVLGRAPAQAFRYQAYAFLADPGVAGEAPPAPPAEIRARYLQLPALDPRIPQLARRMSAGHATDEGRARAIETRLRSDYGYTLELPRHEVADPLAHFLFERRKGHCEYFASAMAVMLRSLGIPARLANGFQSGLWNPLTERYVIRASDAHSWVEAWLPGRGWTTFDPTPPDTSRTGLSLATRLGLYIDAAETFWQEWVLGYDLGRQAMVADRVQHSGAILGIEWLERLRRTARRWTDAAAAGAARFGMPVLFGAVSLALALSIGPRLYGLLRVRRRVRSVRRGEATAGDATLLYGRMLSLLKRRGYQKPSWFTPAEFAGTLPPGLRASVLQFTAAYNALRFGADLEAAPRLSALLDQIEGKNA